MLAAICASLWVLELYWYGISWSIGRYSTWRLCITSRSSVSYYRRRLPDKSDTHAEEIIVTRTDDAVVVLAGDKFTAMTEANKSEACK